METLRQLRWYAEIVGVIYILSTIVYFYFSYKRKKTPTEPITFENQLSYVETVTRDAIKAVNELSAKAGFNRPSYPVEQMKKNAAYTGPNNEGDALVARLLQVKHDIKNIISEVNAVKTWLNREEVQSSKQRSDGQPFNETREPPPHVYDASRNKNLQAPQDSYPESSGQTNIPTIGRRPPYGSSPDYSPAFDTSADYPWDYHGEAVHHEEQRVPGAPAMGGLEREIIQLYNRAVCDNTAREQFRDQYQPIRVGTINAVERRQNPTIEAEFREATDGDFFAFPIPGKDEFAVVPRLGLTIESVSYSAGAVGWVFAQTQGHDPKLFYSRYRVRRPAIFKCDGERWERISPGELDLGPGD